MKSLFVYFVPEGTQEVQIAYLVNFRTGITAPDLYADFLITDFYQIIDDFTKKGIADNCTTYAVGIGLAGKANFCRTAGEVEDSTQMRVQTGERLVKQHDIRINSQRAC